MSIYDNPKITFREVWNKPKASTYCRFGGCMYLDDKGHVTWIGLSEYSSGEQAKAFSDKYREGVPEVGLDILDRWVAAKVAYDNKRAGDYSLPLDGGLAEARKAFVTKTIEQTMEDADPDTPELTGNKKSYSDESHGE